MSRHNKILPATLTAASFVVATLAAVFFTATPSHAGGFEPASWLAETPPQPKVLLVRDATIWTSGPQGRLDHADLLVRQGKIAAVGRHLSAPRGALIIDAGGKHITAGLIDCHSHTAIEGGTNEGTHITTAEVRIEDVLNPDAIDIYRQLAGGLTAANILHGSANSIGGQNAVIKLRWGATAGELVLAGAPPGIKFALGENPKQSNWDDLDELRYPQTRPGVEQSIRERFTAAHDYQRAWKDYRAGREGSRIPPRRDLQLEALVQVLAGERLVHAHSYRADEILMLIRLADEFGFTVASFQHVLEGYKVADEIAAHGAGASTFSDWWAYKFEVIDAIPYNGSLMADRGVVVSFNSDDNELARRLNLEAAKAVRYGGTSESEALKFVTLNPAIQLKVDDRIGSLEKGKDADFVIWSGHPLSTYSLAEQTWIDGRKYFDREQDLASREAIAEERAALLAKVNEESEGSSDAVDGEEGEEATPSDAEEEEETEAGESSAEPPSTDPPPSATALDIAFRGLKDVLTGASKENR